MDTFLIILYVKDLDLRNLKAWDRVTDLPLDSLASPCGLIAKSVFNDTYEIFSDNTYSENARI